MTQQEELRVLVAALCLPLANAMSVKAIDPLKATISNALGLADSLISTAKLNPPKKDELTNATTK